MIIHELGHNENANVELMNSMWQGDNDRRPHRRPSHRRELASQGTIDYVK